MLRWQLVAGCGVM